MLQYLIGFDFGYKKYDRIKQNKRVPGITKMAIKNGYYPIISSVFLKPKVSENAKKNIRFINNVTLKSKVIK